MSNNDTDLRGGTPEWDNAHALSGAYSVDALDDIERVRFEVHLRGCSECRLEVETFHETVAALSVDAVEPPASLRASVLAGIEEIRPLPPLTEQAPARTHRVSTRRPWITSAGPMLVAAALVVVALLTTVWLQPWSTEDQPPATTVTERVLDDPERAVVQQRFPDGATAKVVFSPAEGRAVILTEDMALAPEGKVYELWLQSPRGDMVPAGLMPDLSDAVFLLEGDASDARAVGITIEPDGGSAIPTSTPIALFELEA
ncbi:anti-sigma factor [Nocardioides stalactiti]|uniref:anti-sigma factor n=1 Tax=Nocardioides stalactiti TaxID=2755356 RepID=UPI0016033ABA|nr:anti-sigma factor [Nocardioides stalactiti]